MGITWSDDQLKVINLRNRDILVSAAAGSGKTTVLVERIIRRITDPTDPIDIDELLCDRCRVELVGSGDIDIKRLEAQATTAELVGSGDIDIRQHKVDTTSLLLKGSGDINVDFVDGCNSANCELYGSGDIDLKGSLRHLSSQKRGSGDIDIDKLYVGK